MVQRVSLHVDEMRVRRYRCGVGKWRVYFFDRAVRGEMICDSSLHAVVKLAAV